jgi:hypothetical protein
MTGQIGWIMATFDVVVTLVVEAEDEDAAIDKVDSITLPKGIEVFSVDDVFPVED